MHDLNKTMFHKTSFDIRTTDEGDDALWSLLCSLRAWATRKYPALPREAAFWSVLKRTGRVPFQEGCPVRFRSELCLEDGGNHWALTIEEIAEEPGAAPRHWTTEISFAWTAVDAGSVAVVLSYGDTPGFLGPCQPEPALTFPGFIRTILENDRLVSTASGRPLSLEPTLLHVGQFKDLWNFIADGERETPLVYISPRFEPGSDEPSFAVNPKRVAAALGPSAFVCYSQDGAFTQEMCACIPDLAFRCCHGTVRVYAGRPRVEESSDAGRHRFFPARDIEAMGEEAFIGILRRALAQDVHFYETMLRADGVKRRRAWLIHTKQVKDESVSEALDMVEAAEEEKAVAVDLLEELHHENDQLKARNDELESELYLAQAKATTLEGQLSRAGRQTESADDLHCWPLPYEDILRLFCAHHGDRVDFTDRAYQSLGDCITEPALVWNALHDLCAIAHPLFASRDAGDYAKKFNAQSTFELKRGAGKMTRKDSRLMTQYQDTYQGRAINAEAHLAKGKDDASPNSLRLYFAFDEETGRIIVSSIGKHLDNYSTRYLK